MLDRTGLSPERYRTYLTLLKSLGAFRVTRDSQEVSVAIARAGIAPSGYIKSIVFCPSPPAAVVEDTDVHARGAPEGVGYAVLGDGWHIEFDWN